MLPVQAIRISKGNRNANRALFRRHHFYGLLEPSIIFNRNWYSISGNWLGSTPNLGQPHATTSGFQPFSTGPESSHIIWTRPIFTGGIAGGKFGDVGYYGGQSYEFFWSANNIVINGVLYYNVATPQGTAGMPSTCARAQSSWFHTYWWFPTNRLCGGGNTGVRRIRIVVNGPSVNVANPTQYGTIRTCGQVRTQLHGTCTIAFSGKLTLQYR
jgi:hypothetical protein